MKAYLAVTAALFAILSAVHIWRATIERHLATDPAFVATTFLSAALCAWACRLLATNRAPRS
jgi:hypothetical protein